MPQDTYYLHTHCMATIANQNSLTDMKLHTYKSQVRIQPQITKNLEVTPRYQCLPSYLQGKSQPDEVHHHLLIGQLNGEHGQGSEEQLKVLVTVVLLLTAQVDVTIQLLPMLRGEEGRDG